MRSIATVGWVLAAGALGTALAGAALRNGGATCEERRRPLPGDDVVPEARSASTMATTIDAPPARVWPWLVQMGTDRAGFYSWDRLDNGGRPSAREIRPDWQVLDVGDRVVAHPSGRSWFDVAAVVPERALVLRATIDLRRMRSVGPGEARPRWRSDGTWTFVLEPLEGGRTRLLVRGRGVLRPRALMPLDVLVGGPAHVVMQRRQLRNLARRAEAMRMGAASRARAGG
jgi:hypothetical protein